MSRGVARLIAPSESDAFPVNDRRSGTHPGSQSESSNHRALQVSLFLELSSCVRFGARDGTGRTGTFITMFSVLEKLKPEHLVDVFQILKKARIQRPLLVETQVREQNI